MSADVDKPVQVLLCDYKSLEFFMTTKRLKRPPRLVGRAHIGVAIPDPVESSSY